MGAAALALPQEANAATAYGSSYLNFEAQFDLNNLDLNVFDPDSSFQNYIFDTNNPSNSPQPPIDFFDSARDDLGFNPNFIFLNVEGNIEAGEESVYAYEGILEAYAGPPDSQLTANTSAEVISDTFNADTGDVLRLSYDILWDAIAEIQGFDPGDQKYAFANLGVLVELVDEDTDQTIQELLNEGIFALIEDENGIDQDTFLLASQEEFTFTEDGSYYIRITTGQSVEADVVQPVPEPTSVIGLLGIGALGLGLKRKKQTDKV